MFYPNPGWQCKDCLLLGMPVGVLANPGRRTMMQAAEVESPWKGISDVMSGAVVRPGR